MTIERLLSRLDMVRQCSNDTWLSRCPSHDDNSPSLSIRQANDGTVLLHCFAQCGASDIVQSLDMELADLFPQKIPHNKGRRPMLPYRQMMRALAHDGRVVSLWLNSTDDAPLDPDDLKVVNNALSNIIRVGERFR